MNLISFSRLANTLNIHLNITRVVVLDDLVFFNKYIIVHDVLISVTARARKYPHVSVSPELVLRIFIRNIINRVVRRSKSQVAAQIRHSRVNNLMTINYYRHIKNVDSRRTQRDHKFHENNASDSNSNRVRLKRHSSRSS